MTLAQALRAKLNEVTAFDALWYPVFGRLIEVIEAADGLCPAGPDYDDDRLSWANYQIDKRSMAEFNDALAALRKELGVE